MEIDQRPALSILLLAPLQFREFLACNCVDMIRSNAVPADRSVIQNANAAGRDRSNREFGLSGHAQFADDEDIQWSVERLGDFERDRHAASWERQHDHVALATIRL